MTREGETDISFHLCMLSGAFAAFFAFDIGNARNKSSASSIKPSLANRCKGDAMVNSAHREYFKILILGICIETSSLFVIPYPRILLLSHLFAFQRSFVIERPSAVHQTTDVRCPIHLRMCRR